MSRADDDRFDSMYLSLAQQNQGIDNLFESFFGFLRRKTDYYTGASDAALEEKVLQVRELPGTAGSTGGLGCSGREYQ